jgi:DNA (cytosine-5)-methyltransferase 1
VIYDHPNYIVRRLTPTECARLQGFADWWGVVEQKAELTEEEYLFWMEVRNTHAAINGKKTQDYTPKQMLTWYNKLWTDSAEYKMWGNGIALPTALYCVQGIAEALQNEEDLDDWMN